MCSWGSGKLAPIDVMYMHPGGQEGLTSRKGLKILAVDESGERTTETRNIVCQEVLDKL